MSDKSWFSMSLVERVVVSIVLVAVSMAMLCIVSVEIINRWQQYEINRGIRIDLYDIEQSAKQGKQADLQATYERFHADLEMNKRGNQESDGLTSFLYALTMFAIVGISGFLFKKALDCQAKTQSICDETLKSCAAFRETFVDSGKLHAALYDVLVSNSIAISNEHPITIIRDCISNRASALLTGLCRSGSAIPPALYETLKEGLSCTKKYLDDAAKQQGKAGIEEIQFEIDAVMEKLERSRKRDQV
jgi:hypothetical protein